MLKSSLRRSSQSVRRTWGPESQLAAARERRRIAAEIHDSALQILVTAVCHFNQVARLVERSHPAFQSLLDGLGFAQAAVDRLRRTLIGLRSDEQQSGGLAETLRDVVSRLAHTAPIGVHLGALPDLSHVPDVEEAVRGVLGEAIANAGNHADAQNVWVNVVLNEDFVIATVRDDGKGFNISAAEARNETGQSLGLVLIRERVRLVSGQLLLTSIPGEGTVVEARIPLSRSANGRRGPSSRRNSAVLEK